WPLRKRLPKVCRGADLAIFLTATREDHHHVDGFRLIALSHDLGQGEVPAYWIGGLSQCSSAVVGHLACSHIFEPVGESYLLGSTSNRALERRAGSAHRRDFQGRRSLLFDMT